METKRSLTNEEIKFILNFITPLKLLPPDIANSIAERQFLDHEKQLKNIQIYLCKIPELKIRLEKLYFKSLIQPGKSVGPLASSSIGEKSTQNSLSSKHTSGQHKIALLEGVPRTEELLNVTKENKTPSMDIYLNDIKDLPTVMKIGRDFEYREVETLLYDYNITENRTIDAKEQLWYSYHDTFISTDYKSCEYSIRLLFDVSKLYYYKQTLLSIVTIIEKNYSDVFCVKSPDNIGIIDMYIMTDLLPEIEEVINMIKTTRIRRYKNDEENTNLGFLINDENKFYYFVRDIVLPSVLNLKIGGVDNIIKCYFQQDADTWYITTKGTNLKCIIANPKVNINKTTSNHLWDIYECYGIEAAKLFLEKEYAKHMPINSRHISLLANSQTRLGRPSAVSRYGQDRKTVGLLARIGYEQSYDNFVQAAFRAEEDNLTSVSANITCGTLAKTGTGYMDLLSSDTKKLIDCSKIVYNHFKNNQG